MKEGPSKSDDAGGRDSWTSVTRETNANKERHDNVFAVKSPIVPKKRIHQ